MGAKDSSNPLASRLAIGSSLLLLLAAITAPFAADDPLLILDLNQITDDVGTGNFATPDSLLILSLNMNQFFDDVDNGNNEKVLSSGRFQKRIKTTAKIFGSEFGLPHIVALQEVENLNVLRQLANEIWSHYRVAYRLILIQGLDVSGINLAYMLRLNAQVKEFDQLFDGKILASDGSPLFSRPPLYLEFCYRQKCVSLINLHLRSMRGINSKKKGARVAYKRLQQAETIAAWSNRFQRDMPQASLMLLGDLNALTPSDRHVDVAGIIRGDPDDANTRMPARDLVDPDFIDLTLRIPKNKRYSYIYRRKKQQLDYMLVNRAFAAKLESIEFSRINRRLSDHAALLAKFKW